MASAIDEIECPRCGVKVKKGVLRCRDCGAFLDQAAEGSGTKKSWPGLPEDASKRAAEAAVSAAKAPRQERSEDELLLDMDFAEMLFKQTEERISSVSSRKDEDFLLDVTPISDEQHVRTLKPRPESELENSYQQSSDVRPIAAETQKDKSASASTTKAAKAPESKPPQPPAQSPPAPKAPVAAAPPAVAPPAPVAEYPPAQPLYPQQAPGYVDPYSGYQPDYSGMQGYPQGSMPGYPGSGYPGQDYGQNPAAYQQQYGYVDYNSGAYPPGSYPQQYDPNYAPHYEGYVVDPATGQYVLDPAQQYGIDPVPMAAEGANAGAEPLPSLEPEPVAESIPLEPEPETPAAAPENAESPAAPALDAAAAVAPAAEGPVKSHSEETAGDVLLAAALEEESARGGPAERKSKTGSPKATGLLVFCPYGHRVQVQAKFRGKAGRCPFCKVTFFVPADMEGGEPEPAPVVEAVPTSLDNRTWLEEIHLTRVSPAKVKFTPGSLVDDYDTVDLGVNSDGILVVTLFKAGGLFRSMQEPKKKPITRKAVREYLAAGKPLDQIPAPNQFLLKGELLTQLKMLQPPKPGEESLFSGVPVFGQGRIAVRFPPPTSVGADQRWCFSFTLSQFREFCRHLVAQHGLADFSNSCGVPLEDQFTDVQCSFSNAALRVLENVEYYQADPTFKLEAVARKCQGCGATVAENVRQEHKIGGKADNSVAKSKCPKCQQKFGDIKLFTLKPPEAVAAPDASTAAGSPSTEVASSESSLDPLSSETPDATLAASEIPQAESPAESPVG